MATLRRLGRRTVPAVLLASGGDLLLRQAVLLGDSKVLQRLSGRLCEGILHALRAAGRDSEQLAGGCTTRWGWGCAARSQGTRAAGVVIYGGASTCGSAFTAAPKRANLSFGGGGAGTGLARIQPPAPSPATATATASLAVMASATPAHRHRMSTESGVHAGRSHPSSVIVALILTSGCSIN